MSQHPTYSSEWFAEHREHLGWWRHGNERRILDYLAELQAEVQQLLGDQQDTPATVTITGSNPMDIYAPNQPVYLTANVGNSAGNPLSSIPGAWTCDQGTLTQNPNNPDEATVVNIPIGGFNATFTTQVGSVVGTYAGEVQDDTPATVAITGSTTPPADETTPAPVETATGV